MIWFKNSETMISFLFMFRACIYSIYHPNNVQLLIENYHQDERGVVNQILLFSEIVLGCLYLLYGFVFGYNIYYLLVFDALVMGFACYFAIQAEPHQVIG